MREKKNKKNDFVVPIVVSLLLHVVLVVALLWSTDFNMPKPQASGQMVQAVVIDPKLVQQQANEIRQQREKAAKKEQERLDKLRREAEQLEKNRKAEEEQLRKLKEQQVRDAKAAREAEEVRKKREQEQKVAEEKVRQERDRAAKLEAERKVKEEAIKKAEQERIAQQKAAAEAAEKARKEKARLQQLEKERKEKEAALNDIFSGLQDETAENQQARSRYVSNEIASQGAIYKQLIENKLLKDRYLLGKSCRVNIRLIPTSTGLLVSNVAVISGDAMVCNAAKSAIAQVGEFPKHRDDAVNQELKNINLTVDFE